MTIVDKVVYYLNDVLVSLDIAPIQKVEATSKNENTPTETDSISK